MRLILRGVAQFGRARRSGRRSRRFESCHSDQQKTHFCLPTKVRFLNDVCLRQMMQGFATFLANIASLRNAVEQHHFERSEKHHIAVRRCIIVASSLRVMLIAYSYRTVILSLVEQGGVGKRTVFRVFRVDLLIYLKSAFQNRS